jgi:hypothetical protein
MSIRQRFARYLDSDEGDKEDFLDAVARGEGEAEAVEKVGAKCSTATIRAWLREDADFARAVQAARRGGSREPGLWTADATGRMRSSRDTPIGASPSPFPAPGTSDAAVDAEVAAKGWRRLR